MSEPLWITKISVMLLHAEGLAEFGGAEGLRDEALLESALARPQNMFAYQQGVDLATLAAAYAAGIVRNHPFIDGNKRTGFLAIGLFVGKNGFRLQADKADAARIMFGLAAGEKTEEQLASWIREHMAPR